MLTGAQLGDFNQTAQAFGPGPRLAVVLPATPTTTFATYRAVLNRLTGMRSRRRVARDAAAEYRGGPGLEVDDLTVRRPDAQLVINDLNLSLSSGDTLLIKGPSGSGKTTLLRSWPTCGRTRTARCAGAGRRHAVLSSTVPAVGQPEQRVGLPGARRRDRLRRAREMLRKVQLAHLVDHLDEDTTGPAGCPPASSSGSASPGS